MTVNRHTETGDLLFRILGENMKSVARQMDPNAIRREILETVIHGKRDIKRHIF